MLNKENFRFRRLDGSMTQKARSQSLQDFSNAKRPCLMLISLKVCCLFTGVLSNAHSNTRRITQAGGVGINLTTANRCYLLDCWWNSAVENQATDRVHRIGQTRPVTIVRFLIKSSIEEKMIALQRRKTAIVNAGLGKDQGAALEENLKTIFAMDDEEDGE